jgi:hypothetical protein
MPDSSNPVVSAHRSEGLARRAREIVQSLGGDWRRSKGMCRCPAHDDRTPSLSVTLGRHAILLHCFAGCPNKAVIEALARHGVSARDLFDGSGEPLPQPTPDDSGSWNARRLWRTAEVLKGSLGERYLAGRAITCYSPDLRFHSRTPLGPRAVVRFLPALLAAVRTDVGIIAVHRTFLDPATGGIARFSRPKRTLGGLGHGAVRLAMPGDGRLGLAEGIETALAAMQLSGMPCWATLGNGRFGLVTIPESVRELHLFLDNDAGGDLAELRGREAHARDGRRIVARRPSARNEDWNDVLRRRAVAAA